ncbi:maltase 2-like isoform X2 [Melanaphis sacchari]|nr:maltase 2-like isoform X2 [Melanaphis sacchari]
MVDELFGTMQDFDRLRDAFQKRNIKLILDFVPNHTSDKHPWFIKSVQRKEPYTNDYVWEDLIIDEDGNRKPPNNWLGVFNIGSAWEWNKVRQQYYYHAFQVKQPDLNYRCSMVVEEIKIGNHDCSRVASRTNPLLVDGLHMMQTLLPGTAITYYGDKLGVQDTYVRWNQTVDPSGRNVGMLRYTTFSRDPARSPFPWDDSESAGFTNGTQTWLPINPEYWRENLVQLFKFKSHLRTYRQLSNLRQIPTILKGDLHTYAFFQWVFGFSRSFYDHPTFFVVINFGSKLEKVNIKAARDTLPEVLKVKVSSINSGYVTGNMARSDTIIMRPKAALVFSTSKPNEDIFFFPKTIKITY